MLAIAMAAIAAVPAQAATTDYPSGGSDFAGGQDGWVGSGATCDGTGASACSTSTVFEPAAGNPPGSISVRMSATVNLLSTFEGTGVWTSPAFTVPAGQAVKAVTFAYDRQLAGDLLSLSPQSHVTVELVDTAGGAPATLLVEDLTTANSAFATRSAGVGAGAITAGHTYRLRIATTTTTGTASIGVLGDENTRFDNVGLTLDQAAGVTVVKRFRTDIEINALFRRFDESTRIGHGPGGSLIPRALCTIVGTPGRDRIRGTKGNDVICGFGGNDIINGAGGIDLIDGANGRDRLSGGAAKDKLIGLAGNDRLNGNAGNDRVGGGAGRDVIKGGPGKDRLAARDGKRDRVNGGPGRDRAKVDRPARGARRTKAALRRTDRVRRVERRG